MVLHARNPRVYVADTKGSRVTRGYMVHEILPQGERKRERRRRRRRVRGIRSGGRGQGVGLRIMRTKEEEEKQLHQQEEG